MSAIGQRIITEAQEHKSRGGGFALITLAIVMIVVAGFMSNEMVVYGYSSITQNTGVVCTTDAPNYFYTGTGCSLIGTAYNVANQCNGNASNCSPHSVSFIAPNTPLYYLFVQHNPIAFFSSLFNGQEQSNTYQIGSTICIPLETNASGFLVLSNATGIGIQNFECYGNIAYNNAQPPTVADGMFTSNSGNDSIWNAVGCPYAVQNVTCGISLLRAPVLNFTGAAAQASFYGFYIKNGTSIAATTCAIGGVSLSCGSVLGLLSKNSDTTFTCPDTSLVKPININKTTYYCLIPMQNPSALGESTSGNSFGFLAVISGLIFIVLGLGLYFAFSVVGSGTQMGSNPQGSKLAQHFGIGIFVFGIFDAIFGGGLITFNNILPGLGDLIFSFVIILYFFGLWEML